MARKDDILSNFLAHDLLKDKYGLKGPMPQTVREALKSDETIIATIAQIVEASEEKTPISDAALRNKVTQFLNNSVS